MGCDASSFVSSHRGISECLPRLTCIIRGIGDPLVSVYARAYLCRVGHVCPQHMCVRGTILSPSAFTLVTLPPPKSLKKGLH